ncbi:hypothetical protein [Corynebacterium epidermidicanis]|uniref:Uncharacterized protein n=1 Tax=Corynebacterium epidermidicanis TaxID=1050174 RepID=A0A0G3GU08_9CORY|nr:hypothetical protein [Corynebacterium epidermidicanis]AKK04040.1 hypothetical protein CEPID_11055 [Corynebacterium epidermidicanis]
MPPKNLKILLSELEKKLPAISDEFSGWSVSPIAAWNNEQQTLVVFLAEKKQESRLFGFITSPIECRNPTGGRTESDFAGEIVWYYIAGDFPLSHQTPSRDEIDWRNAHNVSLPISWGEVLELSEAQHVSFAYSFDEPGSQRMK